MQPREVAGGGWFEVGRRGKGDHVFLAVLRDHKVGGGVEGEKLIAEAFQHRRRTFADLLSREEPQGVHGRHNCRRQPRKFTLA